MSVRWPLACVGLVLFSTTACSHDRRIALPPRSATTAAPASTAVPGTTGAPVSTITRRPIVWKVDRIRLDVCVVVQVATGPDGVWVLAAVGPVAPSARSAVPLGRAVYRIDAATGQVVARVPVPEGSETLAASPGAAWVVSQPYGSGAATIERIDARSFEVTVAVRAPGDVLAATDSALWLISGERLTRIDPVRRTVVASVPIPGPPSAVVVSPNGPWVLHGLGNTSGSAVSHIDDRTNTITTTIPIPGDGTAGMVYGHDAVWVDSDNQAVRVDTSTGQVITVPLDQPKVLTTSDTFLWAASYIVTTAKPYFTDNLTLVDITQHPQVSGVLDLTAFAPNLLDGPQVPIAADASSLWIAGGSGLLHIQPRT